MNNFPLYATKISKYLSTQFPEPSEIMLLEIVENFCDKDQCEAFTGAMEFLRTEGYLIYQDSLFGRQLYSMVILTEKGITVSEAMPG